MKKYFIIALCSFALSNSSWSQCDAEKICAEEVLNSSIDEVSPITDDCFDALNTSIYFFTTNNSTANTGDVDIQIDNIDCPDALNGDLIEVTVIELINSNGDPCDPANWANNLGCADGANAITYTVNQADLNPNTGYAIIIGNDQGGGNINCGYDLEISGTWVDIDACCDISITLGDLVSVTGDGSDAGYHWEAEPLATFDNPNIQDPTIAATETTVITMEGEVDGCDLTDVITIFVSPPIDIINTFTPNGDGINETWEIFGIEDFPSATVNIFDRWGQPIFKSIGYPKDWDGTHNGAELPPATYYYVIELNTLDVEIPPFTGWVTIIY